MATARKTATASSAERTPRDIMELAETDRSMLQTILQLDKSLLNDEQIAVLRARQDYLNDVDYERFSEILRKTPLATDDARTKAHKSQDTTE